MVASSLCIKTKVVPSLFKFESITIKKAKRLLVNSTLLPALQDYFTFDNRIPNMIFRCDDLITCKILEDTSDFSHRDKKKLVRAHVWKNYFENWGYGPNRPMSVRRDCVKLLSLLKFWTKKCKNRLTQITSSKITTVSC